LVVNLTRKPPEILKFIFLISNKLVRQTLLTFVANQDNFSDCARFQDGGDDFQGSPLCGQCSMSMSNTRLSKRAQLIRTEAEEGGTASFLQDGLLLFFLLPGIISERNFALGASTPWKRMRLSLGLGTNAASRRLQWCQRCIRFHFS